MTTSNKVYPGMICSGIEFFVVENEEKVIQGGKILPFDQASYSVLMLLQEAINADPKVKAELIKMHPDSGHKRLKQFARCRFGGLDLQPDIKDGVLQEGEYWACPLRGNCSSEGILCRQPQFNGRELSSEDITLIRLISSNLTNENIAEKINKPYGSFHGVKQALYEKLGGVQTKQEVAMIAFFLNLI